MALTVTHTYVNPVVDEGADVTGPDEWNANHTIAGSIAASEITGGAALTKVDDTNVTLTLGGSAATALLAATSLTLGWTGTLAATRGGTGLSALGTGVATALGINVGSAGAFVTFNGALGTPSSGTLTNCSGLPVGGITGFAAGIATWLATPSSANLISAVTDETGTGALVFANTPTLVTPVLGAATATSVVASGLLQAGTTLGISTDALFHRDAAAVIALRDGTTPQTFRVYNTESSSLTNYERGVFDWTTSANVLTIGPQKAGTGSTRGWTMLDGAGASALNYNVEESAALQTAKRFRIANAVVPNILVLDTGGTKTISGGIITVTAGNHAVDTEAAAASDDLVTITNSSEASDGRILIIRPADSTHTVVVKDGTGNIQCAGDFTMDNAQDTMTLMFDGTNWLELSRSDNGA